jgi:hypothetical protein
LKPSKDCTKELRERWINKVRSNPGKKTTWLAAYAQ